MSKLRSSFDAHQHLTARAEHHYRLMQVLGMPSERFVIRTDRIRRERRQRRWAYALIAIATVALMIWFAEIGELPWHSAPLMTLTAFGFGVLALVVAFCVYWFTQE